MAYTQNGIMAQMYVAFGQGTGGIRVSQDVCAALHDRYYQKIDPALIRDWESVATQVLERFRTLGRMMAINAGAVGRSSLAGSDLEGAARIVERQSGTPLCPP